MTSEYDIGDATVALYLGSLIPVEIREIHRVTDDTFTEWEEKTRRRVLPGETVYVATILPASGGLPGKAFYFSDILKPEDLKVVLAQYGQQKEQPVLRRDQAFGKAGLT